MTATLPPNRPKRPGRRRRMSRLSLRGRLKANAVDVMRRPRHRLHPAPHRRVEPRHGGKSILRQLPRAHALPLYKSSRGGSGGSRGWAGRASSGISSGHRGVTCKIPPVSPMVDWRRVRRPRNVGNFSARTWPAPEPVVSGYGPFFLASGAQTANKKPGKRRSFDYRAKHSSNPKSKIQNPKFPLPSSA